MSTPPPDLSPPALLPPRFARWFPVLAFLLPILVPLLAWPTANAPFNDDFAYASMARQIATTGTYHYSAWAAPIVGPWAYYGALLIRLFGDSYTVLHLGALPAAGLTGWCLYRLMLAARLSPALALQASLICTLSPIAIPFAATLMTDVPGQALGLAALLAAVRATSPNTRGRTAFYVLALLLAFFGGMVRQTNWLVAFCIAPLVIALTPLPRKQRIGWSLLLAVCFAAILLANHRNATSPFVIPLTASDAMKGLSSLSEADALLRISNALHSVVFVALPCIAACVLVKIPLRRCLAYALIAIIATAMAARVVGPAPLLGNAIT